MIKTRKVARKPLFGESIQVTDENMHELAEWAKGSVVVESRRGKPTGRQFIKVDVERPMNERQTKAFVTDWIVKVGNSLKVYPDSSYHNSFDEVEEKKPMAPSSVAEEQAAFARSVKAEI